MSSHTGGHTADAHAPRGGPPPDPRRWTVLALLALAQLMLIVDITVVNVSLPSIGADLRLDREALTWVVTGYTLAFGGLMLLGGRLADLFGKKRVLLAGLTVFVLASLTAGLAQNGGMLLGGRLAQGVGAAMLSPAALSTVTMLFHGKERAKALGVWSAIGGAGAAIGVLVGGLLTAGPGWEWVFYVNVPIGLLVLVTVPRLLPPPSSSTADGPARVDVPGALAVTAATASLVYGLVRAGDAGWTSLSTVAWLAGAVALYGVFVLIERRWPQPLMRMSILGRRSVLTGVFLMLMATALMISFFFLGSLYLQGFRGFSALRTGLLFLPVAIAVIIGAQLGGHLLGRIGPRWIAVAGLIATGAGALWLTDLDASSSVYTGFLPGMALGSFGVGPLFVAASTSGLSEVKPHEAGLASGIISTFHELGGSIGVAVMSTVAAASITAVTPTVDGFNSAFTVAAVAAGVSALLAIPLVTARVVTTGTPHVH